MLVDVRLGGDFEATHLPEARNNCVFEVGFVERMAQIAPDQAGPVCVYGSGGDSMESRMAAEKLVRNGYVGVCDFRGGLEAWTEAGFQVMGKPDLTKETPVLAEGRCDVDLGESRIRWIGRNLLNRHEGHISLKSGWLQFHSGKLAGGRFVIDMRSIHCLDLAGDALHDVLIRHLLDHDFFDAERFPEATFEITEAAPLPDATPGAPDLKIQGTLCLKDVSLPLRFEACTGMTGEGKPAAQATLSFDRTLWNVLYASGKWFRHPGGHLVNDLIELQLRIVGK